MRYPTQVSNGGARHKLASALAAGLLAAMLLPAAAHAQDSGTGAITTGDAEADALIAEIERVTAQMVEAREQLRSDRLDPEVLLDAIGREPDAILEWVAAETRWLPYAGVLRGAGGVLMDRSGSSLDRALLLADLLARAGLEVRLANATLPEDTAAALAPEALERAPAPDTATVFALEDEIDGYRAGVRAAAQELAAEVDLLAEPVADVSDPADIIADHWWVQASSQGEWEDYDPLFAASTDAPARPPAETTVDPADIPEELRHSVSLRVVIERYEDGALIEEVPLEHTLSLGGDAPDASVELEFGTWVPPELSDRASETTDLAEGARLAASWRPWLRVDGQTVMGEWFSEAGRVEPPTTLAQAGALSEGLEGLSGLGSDSAQEEAVESWLTAAWIEYETAGPGIEARTERREILDLVGASRLDGGPADEQELGGDAADLARGLAFLGLSEILLQSAATHPDAFIDAYMENFIQLRPAFIALVFLGAGVEDERIGPSLASPETRPIDLLAMTSARDRWAASAAGFIGRPQVWSQHVFFEPGPEGIGSAQAVDIVMNDTGVMPGTDVDPRLVRLEQGILDTLVEHVLAASPDSLNTWDRFARRDAEGTTWSVLQPGSDPGAALAEALPAADLARMRAALARGESVVVANEPRHRGEVPFAEWWRIAEDGTALGVGYRGWGSDISEEAGVTQQISLKSLEPLLKQDRIVRRLRDLEATARRARLSGAYNPYAHLSVFADTQPIIVALARTLPFIYRM